MKGFAMPVLSGDTEIGLRELGKSVQDLLLSYFSGNMPSAHNSWIESDAILAQFSEPDYHILVIFRAIYPPEYEGVKADVVDRNIFHFQTSDAECEEAHHADITVSLHFDENGTLVGKGNIEIKIDPLLAVAPDDPLYAASEYFDTILAGVLKGKDERGH